MIPEPFQLKLPSREKLLRLREAQRRIHERLFGEELARVNLDLSAAERLAYLDWMRACARQHGRSLPANYSVSWLVAADAALAA